MHEVAELLSIDHLLERRPFTLSGTEAQRVALARTLVLDHVLGEATEQCICVRPDSVRIVANGAVDADFVATGDLIDMRWLGPVYELTIDVGVPSLATISAQQKWRFGCRIGDTVTAGVAAEDVRAIKDT